jgi:hypothetical protein
MKRKRGLDNWSLDGPPPSRPDGWLIVIGAIGFAGYLLLVLWWQLTEAGVI